MIVHPVLPVLLILLLCAPVAAIVIVRLVRGGGRMLWALRLVLVLACAAMLLRPGIPGGTSQTLATDTDIVLVVDTTASIVAEDWGDGEPRLDGVRDDVQTIVDEYPGARFALISFDAATTQRLPLTTDASALMSSLDVLRPEVTAQSRGSSIGIAAAMLDEVLAGAAETSPDRSRMVFYFGDGEQTASTAPESFQSSAEHVDGGAVLGYGTAEGGPMRSTSIGDAAGEYIRYEGADALSTLDEDALHTIADELGVPYQHRSADAAIELPEAPTTTSGVTVSGEVGNVTELYWVAAAVALLLLAVELAVAVARLLSLRGLTAKASRPSSRSSSRRAPLSHRHVSGGER